MLDCERPSLERQLLSNQIWETVAFIPRAAFMIGLTPGMIRICGAQGYGEFALASSVFVLPSLVDLVWVSPEHGLAGKRSAPK